MLRYGAYSKEVLDRLRWMEDVMARSRTDFGTRVGGLGDRWFIASVAVLKGRTPHRPGDGEHPSTTRGLVAQPTYMMLVNCHRLCYHALNQWTGSLRGVRFCSQDVQRVSRKKPSGLAFRAICDLCGGVADGSTAEFSARPDCWHRRGGR